MRVPCERHVSEGEFSMPALMSVDLSDCDSGKTLWESGAQEMCSPTLITIPQPSSEVSSNVSDSMPSSPLTRTTAPSPASLVLPASFLARAQRERDMREDLRRRRARLTLRDLSDQLQQLDPSEYASPEMRIVADRVMKWRDNIK